MKANIFNIQKFCLHDGPGIRTTVFFKGCNLRCAWCANPESQADAPQLTLDREKCRLCGSCIQACAAGARSIREGIVRVDSDACILCGACLEACPSRAVGSEGHCMTLDAVLEEVMKDKPFYDRSGGGVTLSGGEVLMQREFAVSLARELHERCVHVAIETAAAVEPEIFRAFIREIDYVFLDLKHYDAKRYVQGTGVENGCILENIALLRDSGLAYTIRIPVIPSYNDALEDAAGFAELLNALQVHRVQLLPFHQLGERKYELLGREYAYAGRKQLHREDLKEYRAVLESHGIQAEL